MGVDRHAGKRRCAADDNVLIQHGLELERERIERPSKLAGGDDERRVQAFAMPAIAQRPAGIEVIGRERRDERGRVTFGIRDERLEPRAEDACQIVRELIECAPGL